jgi:cell division septation protein DedD
VNSLLHRDGDDDLDDLNGSRDREITLGTTMILGIFFALAVLCAVFFGLGYQLGHKAAVPTPPTATTDGSSSGSFAGFKPAAGSPVGSPADKSSGQTAAIPYAPAPVSSAPAPRPAAAADESNQTATSDTPAPVAAPAPAPRPVPAPVAAPAPLASTPAPSGAAAIVQIAAVSHQEDADLLVTTLKRRGYNVAVRSEPQDKLLHVQVGPFASHKDADAMRQKLLADGFNAIVKDTK